MEFPAYQFNKKVVQGCGKLPSLQEIQYFRAKTGCRNRKYTPLIRETTGLPAPTV
jgi:hypothetical protein